MNKKFKKGKPQAPIYGITSERKMQLEARASNRAALNRAKKSGMQDRWNTLRESSKGI